MLIKAASLVTVADASGEAMVQGSMLRYLNEMMWFPTAFLGDNISFEAIGDTSARVTPIDHGRTATATMSFDAEGRLIEFVAKRSAMAGSGSRLATWLVPVIEYGEVEGLRLPVRVKAVWRLADGDLDYIDVRITQLQYEAVPNGAGPLADRRLSCRVPGCRPPPSGHLPRWLVSREAGPQAGSRMRPPGERTPIVGSVNRRPSPQPRPARRRSAPPPAAGSAATTSGCHARRGAIPPSAAAGAAPQGGPVAPRPTLPCRWGPPARWPEARPDSPIGRPA